MSLSQAQSSLLRCPGKDPFLRPEVAVSRRLSKLLGPGGGAYWLPVWKAVIFHCSLEDPEISRCCHRCVFFKTFVKFQLGRQIQRVLCRKGEACLGTPLRCWPGPRGLLIPPEVAPGCQPSLGMSLCGIGLLGDNLSKILDRARGSALWRPAHSQKLDLAPGHLVPRPGSAERPGFSPPRSVGGFARAGAQEASFPRGPMMGVEGDEAVGLFLLGALSWGQGLIEE